MHSVISCPQCQASLRVPADNPQGLVQCGVCGWQFSTGPEQVIDAIVVEEEPRAQPAQTRVRPAEPAPLARRAGGTAALRTEEQPQAHRRAGCFLHGLALLPLGIAAAGIPLCRFGTGWIGGVVWAALGVGLALICLNLARRTQWSWVGRLLGSLGLTAGGYFLLLIALAVGCWQWWHAIDPADWRDFAPPGGRFHISMPGSPDQPPNWQPVRALAFTSDGKRLVLARNKRLEQWELSKLIGATADELAAAKGRPALAEPEPDTGGTPARIEAHVKDNPSHGVFGMALADEGKTLVTCGWDCRVCVWDLASGKQRREWRTFPLPVSFAVSPDGSTVALADATNAYIYLFDAATGERSGELPPYPRKSTTMLAFAPDGKTLAVAADRSLIERWNPTTRKVRDRWATIPEGVRCLSYSPDGRTLATGSDSGPMVRLHQAATGKVLVQLPGAQGGAHCVTFSADGRRLAASGARQPSTVLLWDVQTGRELRRITGPKRAVSCVALSPDGQTLASGGDGQVHMYDTATGQRLAAFSAAVTCLLFSRDGRTLIAGTRDGTVELWNVARLARPKLPAEPPRP